MIPSGTEKVIRIPEPELMQRAHKFGMIQNQVEVDMFLDWYFMKPFSRIMEIGTHTGGFLSLLIAVGSPKDSVISVDLPWRPHEYEVGQFRKLQDGVQFIVGNSHEEVTRQAVISHLGENKLDFLFLDGDHSYDGVSKDFEMYSPLVRSGGWIGFHDINNGHQCGDFYWRHAILNRPHVEFGFGRTFGLGCVRTEDK